MYGFGRFEAEERARYEKAAAAAAASTVEDRQRYPASWRELDGGGDRRHEDRKRLALKEEEWFHREERIKAEERSRYERVGKYDAQQVIGHTVPDRSAFRVVSAHYF